MAYKTPTCAIAKSCGGCEWLSVPYPVQLERKRSRVLELFDGFFRARRYPVTAESVAILGMEVPLEYRHKAATPFAPGKKGTVRSGFYERGTHCIVPCSQCLTEDPRCRPILNNVARAAERLGISAYNEDRGRGLLRHAIVRTGWKTSEGLLTIVCNGTIVNGLQELAQTVAEAAPLELSVVQNINQRRTNAMLGSKSRPLLGPGVMHDTLLGVTFEIGPTSFYQTNPEQTEVLYEQAIAQAGLASGMRLLDAYCGIGTIGLCAAKQVPGLEVVGVERVDGAVADARHNAQANSLETRARFVEADATQYLRDAAHNRKRFDVVVMDPPRAGSTPEFIASLCALAPERVVYVSCNPETQVRDIELITDGGYLLDALTCVDMFPYTSHIETVATLTRA